LPLEVGKNKKMSERAQSENKVIVWAVGEQCDKPEADNINNVSNDKKSPI